MALSDNPAKEQTGSGALQYLKMPQILLNEISNGFGNQRLQLPGCRYEPTPQIFRSFTAPPHSQKCVIMINDRFRDNEGMCRVGKKVAHYTLQSGQLVRELCCSFGISVKPFLYKINLIGEMEGGGTKGRRVEGSFFETDRARNRHSISMQEREFQHLTYQILTQRSQASRLGVTEFVLASTSSACLQPYT